MCESVKVLNEVFKAKWEVEEEIEKAENIAEIYVVDVKCNALKCSISKCNGLSKKKGVDSW